MSSIGSTNSGVSTSFAQFLTTGAISDIILAATTETSVALPALTKYFALKSRSPISFRISYSAGLSVSNYWTVNPGDSFSVDRIGSATTTLWLYAISPTTLELETWV